MDLSPNAERLRAELLAALSGAPVEVQDAGERLSRVLDASVRLTLFEVLADAAAEITSALPSDSVSARLNGREIDFVVEQAPFAGQPRMIPVARPAAAAAFRSAVVPPPPASPGAPFPPPAAPPSTPPHGADPA